MEIYHNPRCSKSRQALDFLEKAGKTPEIKLYLKNALSPEELKSIISKLGIAAEDLVRKSEPEYKEHYKGTSLDDSGWIDAMIEYPKLMQRPILVAGEKAIVARPPELGLTLI